MSNIQTIFVLDAKHKGNAKRALASKCNLDDRCLNGDPSFHYGETIFTKFASGKCTKAKRYHLKCAELVHLV